MVLVCDKFSLSGLLDFQVEWRMSEKSHLLIRSLVQQDFQGMSEILKAVYSGKGLSS